MALCRALPLLRPPFLPGEKQAQRVLEAWRADLDMAACYLPLGSQHPGGPGLHWGRLNPTLPFSVSSGSGALEVWSHVSETFSAVF